MQRTKQSGSLLTKIFGSKIRSRYNNYTADNQEIRESMNRVLNFAHKNKFIISSDLDNYHNKDWKLSRIILVSLTRLSTLLNILRFGLIGSIKNPIIRTSMADVTYLLGNQSLLSILFSMVLITILFIEIVVQFQEMTQTFSIFKFSLKVSSEGVSHDMNLRNSKKIIFILSMMSRYLLKPVYWIMFPVVMSLYLTLSAILIYHNNNWATLVFTFLWLPPSYLCLQQIFTAASIGLILWTVCTLYLRYVFEEIHSKVKLSLCYKNPKLLTRAAADHQVFTDMTDQLNGFFKYITLILYYLATPSAMIVVYLIGSDETKLVTKVVGSY